MPSEAKAATGSDSEEAVDAMAARAAVLVRQGRVQEVGRGLYRRKRAKVEEDAGEVGPAPQVIPITVPVPALADAPELAVLLALFPPRSELTLDALKVAAGGEPSLARGKIAGHVYRLVQRGLLERTAARTYRRVQNAAPEEIGLLRHFEGGVVLRLGEVVVKEEGRVTASGLGRMKAELERLVRVERLERAGGGYKKVEERGRGRGLRAASPVGVRVHLAGRVVVLPHAQAKALAMLSVFNGVGSEALPPELDAVALKAAGLVEEKDGRWNRVFEVWLEGVDDWTQERGMWLEMAGCADDVRGCGAGADDVRGCGAGEGGLGGDGALMLAFAHGSLSPEPPPTVQRDRLGTTPRPGGLPAWCSGRCWRRESGDPGRGPGDGQLDAAREGADGWADRSGEAGEGGGRVSEEG